jgi:hypothetical protein
MAPLIPESDRLSFIKAILPERDRFFYEEKSDRLFFTRISAIA